MTSIEATVSSEGFSVDSEHDLSSHVSRALPKARSLYWGGEWHDSDDTMESINPSTGQSLGSFCIGGVKEVDAAVKHASAASPAWARMPPLERGRRLREAAARVRTHARDLALIDAADCGNPVKAMLLDAEIAATQLEYFAGLVLELKGETIPTANGSLNYTLREPLGVVARICAFNHPFMFAAGKIAAPLAAGNTVVIKPPEQAPLSTLRLMELLSDVFPPGVLNCITGGRATGAALASHPAVAAVGLIGSVSAGRSVLHAAADTMKRTLLELGGKNAMILFPDVNVDRAVSGAIKGMNFGWCGQSCGSTSRLFVHETIYDEVVQKLQAVVRATFRPGIATDLRTTMGALISRGQQERTIRFIKAGLEEGASLICGGTRPDDSALASGYFIDPTIFSNVEPHMAIAREEIFGPVLSVLKWSDEEAMFEAVNGVEYGLTGSIWTSDLNTALRTASRIQVGYVWVNDSSSHIVGAPFGGVKQSGIGREESKEEMFEFTQIKNVNICMS